MFPEPVVPGTDVPRFLYFNSGINRLQILPTPWYDSRLIGAIQVLRNAISLEIGPPPTPS